MSFVNTMFTTEKSTSVAFYAVTKTKVKGDITESSALSMTKDCFFWRGKMADAVLSERLRGTVDGVVCIDFDDYTSTVNPDDYVIIDSQKYAVVEVDNIAEQDEVIVIPVKRFQ